MAFDSQTFKNIMSRWATGISVITTSHEGVWQGFTANSFASVSVDPLLISLSVAKSLHSGELIQKSGAFTVNILTETQAEWGKLFAGMFKDITNRFENINCSIGNNNCPILPNTLGYMECTVYKTIDVGASTLLLGEVTNGALTADLAPLLYYHHQWGRFSAITE